MAEIEYKGIKLGGSKLLLLVPLLGTIGSGLFFGFEFYKDYMIMRSKIEKYVKPDLSGIDKKLAVLHKEMIGLKKSSDEARDYSRDIKNFFDTQVTLQDTPGFFSGVRLDDGSIQTNNVAQYLMFGGSNQMHSQMVDSQWQK